MPATSLHTDREAAILAAVAGHVCVEANPGAVVRDSRVDAERGATLSTPGEARDANERLRYGRQIGRSWWGRGASAASVWNRLGSGACLRRRA